jgi:DNA-binding NarL/FixJ family response regulator
MGMPDLTGVEAARKIRRSLPEAELLIFTASESEQLIREVFEAGAKSYILKADAGTHLIEAVRAISEHRPFFTSKIAEVVFAKFVTRGDAKAESEILTDREREVVRLLAQGMSNKQVADTLALSVRTVETHRANLLRKLRLSSLAALVRYAVRNGIVSS